MKRPAPGTKKPSKPVSNSRARRAPKALWAPTPAQIENAPELASLATLGCALEMATTALLVAHPELCDLEPRESLPATATQATNIIESARRLAADLAGYRSAIEKDLRRLAESTDDVIPF